MRREREKERENNRFGKKSFDFVVVLLHGGALGAIA